MGNGVVGIARRAGASHDLSGAVEDLDAPTGSHRQARQPGLEVPSGEHIVVVEERQGLLVDPQPSDHEVLAFDALSVRPYAIALGDVLPKVCTDHGNEGALQNRDDLHLPSTVPLGLAQQLPALLEVRGYRAQPGELNVDLVLEVGPMVVVLGLRQRPPPIHQLLVDVQQTGKGLLPVPDMEQHCSPPALGQQRQGSPFLAEIIAVFAGDFFIRRRGLLGQACLDEASRQTVQEHAPRLRIPGLRQQLAVELDGPGILLVAELRRLCYGQLPAGSTPGYENHGGQRHVGGGIQRRLARKEGITVGLHHERRSHSIFPLRDPLAQFLQIRSDIPLSIPLSQENFVYPATGILQRRNGLIPTRLRGPPPLVGQVTLEQKPFALRLGKGQGHQQAAQDKEGKREGQDGTSLPAACGGRGHGLCSSRTEPADCSPGCSGPWSPEGEWNPPFLLMPCKMSSGRHGPVTQPAVTLRQHPGPADTSFVGAPPSRVEDPGANFFGVAVSNGLDITVGSR